jgi:hypothetical protein
MKIKIWTVLFDTDDGTYAKSYGSEAGAEEAYTKAVNSIYEDGLLANNYEEAMALFEKYQEGVGFIDTIILDDDEIEIEITA